jgi:signal transduction histidine kinase
MGTTKAPATSFGPAPLADRLEHGAHSHVVQFYSEDSALLDGLSRFLGSAIGAGDSAVVIATASHLQELSARLQALGFDLPAAASQNRYVALDAAATLSRFMVEGWPDTSTFMKVIGTVLAQAAAAANGPEPRVAAFGEMVALLCAEGKVDAALRLEQLWNELAHTHSFSLHCAYPINDFPGQAQSKLFLNICAEHSAVIPGEAYTSLTTEDQRLRTIADLQQKAQALASEVAHRKRIEEELLQGKVNLERLVEQRTVSLQRLSSHILVSQDSERRRIARELHDSLGQYLVGLKLNIDLLRRTPGRPDLWSEAQTLLDQSIAELRTISHLLHPPAMDIGGLAAGARWYVEGFAKRSRLRASLDLPDQPFRLPDPIELLLFRVLQEALTNVHRHSGASATQVQIQVHAHQVILRVKDNGRGIPDDSLARFHETGLGMGVGITGMRERVRELLGTFTLESSSTGTSVRVALPLPS